jgi:[protein-PII] uridylyltransferase
MTDLTAVRQRYRASKAQLLENMASPSFGVRNVHLLLKQLAQLADATLVELWQHAGLGAPLALLAVGGFGRGELFPHSDVDVLILLPDTQEPDTHPACTAQIESFIGACWDVGLEIGSSVRTLSECLTESGKDVTIQTALLECRHITGNAALTEQFKTAFFSQMDARAFFVAKSLEMSQRHAKFEDTPYALEPNCKESPGGLRDLHIILWVSKAAHLGQSWSDLAENGLATPFEVQQIQRNEALLMLVRARLHSIARRREDRLIFDMQNTVAEAFGYQNLTLNDHPDGKVHIVRAGEALMKRYYWAAKAVTQLNQILLMNIEERLNPTTHGVQPLNARFQDKAGMIDVIDDRLYHAQPHAILETFLLFQSHPGIKGLSARTLRALYNARSVMNAHFRKDPVNHANFMRILKAPEGITHAMRLMNQTSVLGRYLWVFRRIVGQMQHDLFHVYTVDQHILMVLRNVRRFFMAEHAHEYPLCSQLAAGWDKPWILYVAALFHDIAKGRGGDHSELGALEVRRFCKQHQINQEDSRLIEFLVQEHLSMSQLAQKADLSDPDVIAQFAHKVGNERTLTALYLLTVADIRGTSPKVWNAWKGKLLEDLYRATVRTLGGVAPDPQTEVEARKREALSILALYTLPHDAHKSLWDTLDVGYFMRHEASDIAWHTKHLSRCISTEQAVVQARRSPLGEGLQVMVYTQDRPDLFARICGYFDQAGLSIQDARIHTSKKGYALDTFQVVTTYELGDHYRELCSQIENGLRLAIHTDQALSNPSKGRISRRVKSFPIAPRVSLRPDEKAQLWLLNISASDRLGLLYCIAQVLARHHIQVQLAKIATLGERVEDTFLIHGSQLAHNRSQIAIETELLDALS